MKKTAILFILLAAAACNPVESEEVLLPREDISLTVKGELQFSYDPLTCQISQNVRENEYRIYDDILSSWFTLKCSEMPLNEGQGIWADLSWTGTKKTETLNGLEFTVKKTDSKGKIWLWCEKKSIGIVIKNL